MCWKVIDRRPFHIDWSLTQKVQVCMRVVQANETERTPPPPSVGSDHSQYQTQIDTGQLGKLEQCLTGTATPRRQPCTLYAVGQGASTEPLTCNLLHD